MGEGLLLKLLLIFNKYKNILVTNFICIYRHKRLPFLYSLCMSLYLANTSANQNAAIVSFSLKDNYDMMIIFVFFFLLSVLHVISILQFGHKSLSLTSIMWCCGFLVWCNNTNMTIFIYRWMYLLVGSFACGKLCEEEPEDIILNRVTTWEIRMFGAG